MTSKVGHVVRIDPQISDEESDQGMGSDTDEIKEELIKEEDPTGKTVTFFHY